MCRALPVWQDALLILFGLVFLAFGAARALRFSAALLGALSTALLLPSVLHQVGVPVTLDPTVLAGIATLLACAFALSPPAGLFLAVGLPAGTLAAMVAGPSDWFLGFVPAFLLLGALGALWTRHAAAVLSSFWGAMAASVGILALLQKLAQAAQSRQAEQTFLWISVFCLACIGIASQLFIQSSPEEAEKRKRERDEERRRRAEKEALEERWANYSAKKQK
jgi:hypothetical protein